MRSRLTYANVISTLCLFLLLGGGAALAAGKLATNSVGTKQLKNGAVTGAKIKNGAITGAKVSLSSLGTVPTAANSQALDGLSAAQKSTGAKLHCPSDMTLVAGVCFETNARPANNMSGALEICGEAGRMLPTESELIVYMKTLDSEPHEEWAQPYYYDSGTPAYVRGISVKTAKGKPLSIAFAAAEELEPFRCVVGPSN